MQTKLSMYLLIGALNFYVPQVMAMKDIKQMDCPSVADVEAVIAAHIASNTQPAKIEVGTVDWQVLAFSSPRVSRNAAITPDSIKVSSPNAKLAGLTLACRYTISADALINPKAVTPQPGSVVIAYDVGEDGV